MSKKHVTNFRGEGFDTPEGKFYVKDEPKTPMEEDFEFGDYNRLDFPLDNDFGFMRKSMSMNDINTMREDLMNEDLMLHDSSRNIYHRHRRPTSQPQELSKTKFVSMAEAIYHYQRDTPGRFHSTRPQRFRPQGFTGRAELTRPQSPNLRSKARSRPLHVMTQQEKEEMELEEIKKYQIKAQPLPKAVLYGPIHLPEVSKKPNTKPEPFNLTKIQKKLDDIKSPEPVFKARPAPKHILEKPQVPVKPILPTTKPVSPKFHYKKANSEKTTNKPEPRQKSADKPQRHGPLRAEPFSFEHADEERKKRKEERIRRQIEEEKQQASAFKAQPLPGGVRKRMLSANNKKGSASTISSTSDNKENFLRFEARPPVVLYKEPFKPVLQPVQLVKPMPFDLSTQKRAAEREKFDKQQKEKEEEMERLREERARQQELEEEKAQMKLRAKLVHHAKPMPAFTGFLPEKAMIPVTMPQTPQMIRRLRQN